jgi:sodium transport system permease protein
MNVGNALIVFRKELRDMLRDKRTIRSMIIIPVVAFPLLFLVVGWAMVKFSGEASKEASVIMVHGGDDSPKILDALKSADGIHVVPYQSDARQKVADKSIRALVEIPDRFDSSIANEPPERVSMDYEVSIDYFEGDIKSEMAKDKLQKFFDDYRVKIARQALAARGLPTRLLEPFDVRAQNIAPASKVGAAVFGGWIPYMIIILCFTGAMYPAMDLTAGEKERGTMETILTSPVARTDLVIGKFLMVVLASVVTAILSLCSMGISFAWSKRSFLGGSGMQMSIDPSALLAVIFLLLPLAVLFAAVLLAVALIAKSYREAQSYVSPLVFVVILPAIIGAMPGIELNWKTALIPILSTSLVSKDVIAGNYHWGLMAAAFGMTCVYAAIAIAAAVRMFNREDVLFRV